VVKNFKKLLPFLASKDLSAEKKKKYQLIDFLFRTRNKIVHEGEAYYKNDSGIKHIVDFKKSHDFFFSGFRRFKLD